MIEWSNERITDMAREDMAREDVDVWNDTHAQCSRCGTWCHYSESQGVDIGCEYCCGHPISDSLKEA